MSGSFPIRLSSHYFLRPFQDDDKDALTKHANNKAISDNMHNGFPYPFTDKHAEAFIRRANAEFPYKMLAIAEEDGVIGATGIWPQSDLHCLNGELGYWLAEAYWNKGIATMTVKSMLHYGFSHFGLNRIFARPFPENHASRRVLEKSGFRMEARLRQSMVKNGVVFDELIYAILKEDFR